MKTSILKSVQVFMFAFYVKIIYSSSVQLKLTKLALNLLKCLVNF